jgi:hypothetical protein
MSKTHHELDLDLIHQSEPTGFLEESFEDQEEMRKWEELPDAERLRRIGIVGDCVHKNFPFLFEVPPEFFKKT